MHIIKEENSNKKTSLCIQHKNFYVFCTKPKKTYEKKKCNTDSNSSPKSIMSESDALAPKPSPKDAPACRMLQIPINLNDATTGHKLQGLSKDIVIITSWPSGGIFTNWEYVVLSRVRTIKGLFLIRPISMKNRLNLRRH